MTGTTPIVEVVDDPETEVHHLETGNRYMTASNMMMHHALETIEATETTETTHAITLHAEAIVVAHMLRDSNVLS